MTDATINANAIIPTSPEGWLRVPDVAEGITTFRSNSDDARFVEGKLKSKVIPLSAPPGKVRAVFPSLHQYRKSSFQTWYYKTRKDIQFNEEESLAPPAPSEAVPTGKPADFSL